MNKAEVDNYFDKLHIHLKTDHGDIKGTLPEVMRELLVLVTLFGTVSYSVEETDGV